MTDVQNPDPSKEYQTMSSTLALISTLEAYLYLLLLHSLVLFPTDLLTSYLQCVCVMIPGVMLLSFL